MDFFQSSNGLFDAKFEAPTLVQLYFCIHCVWTGMMGVLCTYDPSFSPITENGVFTRDKPLSPVVTPAVDAGNAGGSAKNTTAKKTTTKKTTSEDPGGSASEGAEPREEESGKETVHHPNVRGAWNVRGGSMFIVTAGALYFGTRETYLIAMAAAIWREVYDCIEMLLFKTGGKKIVFGFWFSPVGPMPPLVSFIVGNVLAFYGILMSS